MATQNKNFIVKTGLDVDNGLMTVTDGAGVLDISTKDGFSVYVRSGADWSSTFPGGFYASNGSTVDTSSFSVYGKVGFNEYSGGYTFPFYDGTAGQVLTTDGAGNLTFADAAGGDLVDDTTPQLGGELDVNGKTINMSGSASRIAAFSGGDVVVDSYGVVGNAGNIYLTTYAEGGGRGNVIIDGIKHPTSDGTAGQVLTTDGSGNLSFADASGGISNVVEDTTPQLGGNLDLNGNSIVDSTTAFAGSIKFVDVPGNGTGLHLLGPTGGEGGVHVIPASSADYGLRVEDGAGNSIISTYGPYVTINSINYPIADGTAGQVLTTDGIGTLSFADASSGGGDFVAATTTLDNPNAYNTSQSDNFGKPVAISGNYAIVGTYNEDDAGGSTSGKAYIYNVITGSLIHTLDNPNAYSTSANDYFGYSVAISGNRAIVGAYQEDDAGGSTSGKAYMYDVSTGSLLYTLDNPSAYGTSSGDRFGFSVAIDGNYAVVGAYYEDDSGGFESGKAYIFDVDTGSLTSVLNNPNDYNISAADQFGSSVAISGNRAIVGAMEEDDASGTTSGKAYMYDVTTGNLLYTLNNPNPYSTSASDRFGVSVSIDGNYAIVGAYGEDDAGGGNSGKAYIYDVSTGSLLHTLDNPTAYGTSSGDLFGINVSISGNYAIAAAWGEDDAGGSGSGKAYIFNVTTGVLVHTLDNPNAYGSSGGDSFGEWVGISDNYVIVGAPFEDEASGNDSGKAYIFELALPFDKLSDDPAPQLGGDLDLNGNKIIGHSPFTDTSVFAQQYIMSTLFR